MADKDTKTKRRRIDNLTTEITVNGRKIIKKVKIGTARNEKEAIKQVQQASEARVTYKGKRLTFNELAKEMDIDLSLCAEFRAGLKKLTKEKQRKYRELQEKREEFFREARKFNVGVADKNPPQEFLDLQEKAEREAYDPMRRLEDEMKSLQTRKELAADPQKENAFKDKWMELIKKELIEKDKRIKELEEEKKEIYKTPKFLEEIQRSIFRPTGLRDKDFMGFAHDGNEEVAEWDIKGGKARYPKSKQAKIDRKKTETGLSVIPTPPKLGVSQVKNIDTLGFMLQRENWLREKNGKEKLAELEFSLKDYAKMRGYDDKQIARGGEFYNELKRDLFAGAYTTYRLDKVIIDGKEYIAHGLPNIYILLEPKNEKDKWKIKYNEPYRDYYLNGTQYYPILLKAIKDKGTDKEKGFLYFFFKLVMSYASTTDFRTQLKVSTLLDKIKIRDAVKSRPREAFKTLCECIYYTASKYRVIKEVRFFNNRKCVRVKAITDLEKFNGWDYNDFTRDVLVELGLNDIRDALVSFNTPSEAKLKGAEERGQIGRQRAGL